MGYTEIIKRNNKKYFYFTKNIRLDSNKWRKIRIYLGNKKPHKKKIQEAAEEIEIKLKKIKLKNYLYLEEKYAELLQDLKEGYSSWIENTPENVVKKHNEDFIIRFTYNTNAIEGNRLTLRQTALILKDKVIPTGIRASDYHEAINGRECLTFLKNYKGDINEIFVCKINDILTKNTDVSYPGRIRFFEVSIEGSNYKPPEYKLVKNYLNELFRWYKKNKNKLHPFELACLLHHKIVWIHPFEDGNGRTARALMNFILIKNGYPMFFIPYEKREKYYMSIEEADKGDYKDYIKRILDLIIEQVKSYIPNDKENIDIKL